MSAMLSFWLMTKMRKRKRKTQLALNAILFDSSCLCTSVHLAAMQCSKENKRAIMLFNLSAIFMSKLAEKTVNWY